MNGSDKTARQAAKLAAENALPPPLEPPFPFTAAPFDPSFFGVDKDAQPAAKS